MKLNTKQLRVVARVMGFNLFISSLIGCSALPNPLGNAPVVAPSTSPRPALTATPLASPTVTSSSEGAQPAPITTQVIGGRTWVTLYSENFENLTLPQPNWAMNDLKEENRYSDEGEYFKKLFPDFKIPNAYRAHASFGQDNWLRLESYSRSSSTELSSLFSVKADPAQTRLPVANKVLKIESLAHSDGTVLRSQKPLPPEYRICAKVGYADFGSGKALPDLNGYIGNENASPWIKAPSVNENGFYWLAILMDEPKPRNNVWIHHHRKVVIDSDNNWYPANQGGPWSRIFDGKEFSVSGEHPVMVFVLDRSNKEKVWNYDRSGQPFISLGNDQWNVEAETHQVRAVDAYLDNTWYEACIMKEKVRITVSVEGEFKYGGKRKYENSIDSARVFDPDGTPDYFMMGDPHINFYRGKVFYDDIRLEVPQN